MLVALLGKLSAVERAHVAGSRGPVGDCGQVLRGAASEPDAPGVWGRVETRERISPHVQRAATGAGANGRHTSG